MRTQHNHYKINPNHFISHHQSTIFLLQDSWEDFKPEDIPTYFAKNHKIFLSKIKKLKNINRPLTEKEAQELSFMLESLIHAHNATHETLPQSKDTEARLSKYFQNHIK